MCFFADASSAEAKSLRQRSNFRRQPPTPKRRSSPACSLATTPSWRAVDHEIDHAAAQVSTQDAENRTDKERDDQARREERQARDGGSFRRYGEVFRLETTPPTFPG